MYRLDDCSASVCRDYYQTMVLWHDIIMIISQIIVNDKCSHLVKFRWFILLFPKYNAPLQTLLDIIKNPWLSCLCNLAFISWQFNSKKPFQKGKNEKSSQNVIYTEPISFSKHEGEGQGKWPSTRVSGKGKWSVDWYDMQFGAVFCL